MIDENYIPNIYPIRDEEIDYSDFPLREELDEKYNIEIIEFVVKPSIENEFIK